MKKFVAQSACRVEERTAAHVNKRIEDRIQNAVAYYREHPEEIDARLIELDQEWDTERLLQLNSSVVSLVGLGLGLTVSRKWLLLPVAVQLFFAQHAVQGWCPPLPAFRRIGVRTMREIEKERRELRIIRDVFARRFQREVEAEERREHERPAAEQDGEAVGGRLRTTQAPARRGRFSLPPTRDRVQRNTPNRFNQRISTRTDDRVRFYSEHPGAAHKRLEHLDREWDIERVIEVEGPVTTLTGIALSTITGRRSWLGLSIFAQGMMALHAVQGFYPLLPLLRWMGLRTSEEILAERDALRAAIARGDDDSSLGATDEDDSAQVRAASPDTAEDSPPNDDPPRPVDEPEIP